MDSKDILSKIVIVSSEKMMESEPSQDIPNSPNALTFHKWYKEEIIWANSKIDLVEDLCEIKNTCTKGCSSCCNQPIAVVPTEMLGIQQFIKNLDMKERKELFDKVSNVCDTLAESGVKVNISGLRKESSIQRQMEEYFALGISCPLLSDDNTCLVYDVRPINCWSYRMYGDPKDCNISHNPDYGLKFDDWESVILKRILEARMTRKDKIALLPFALKDILKEFI